MLRALAGAGDPWKRVLRRASTEEEARKIFALAEAALDTEQATPVGADVRASRTIRMLGEEYLRDCWAAYILLTQRLGDSADGISGLAISTARGRCADARPTPTLTIGFLALHQTPNLLAVAGIALVVAGVNRSRRQMVAGRAQPSPG